MGLQGRLDDVSSDSIPLMLLALAAAYVNRLGSFIFGILHSLGLHQASEFDDGVSGPSASVGSGLARLVLLAEQLNLNRLFSYKYRCGGGDISQCVVCLCRFTNGDEVRKLDCRHVFHKACFDGWLDHLNFTCPLCRSPLVTRERMVALERGVGQDLISWFALQ